MGPSLLKAWVYNNPGRTSSHFALAPIHLISFLTYLTTSALLTVCVVTAFNKKKIENNEMNTKKCSLAAGCSWLTMKADMGRGSSKKKEVL